MTLSPGTRLGPYEIESELGRGGMGEVYRARDTRLGREVAIKILPVAFAADPESVRRFEKEAHAVASLSHPNIVTLLDVGEEQGVRYAVAELVAGETIRTRMARGPLSPREAAEIAAQIADGLAAAHEKGVVHRDVKPENVVITPSGFARILDFGLAKRSAPTIGATSEDEATRSALLTEPGIVAGTVGYMSPEQVRGEIVDGRSDIFALGVVLWEMLTGRRPFKGDSQVETLNAILKEEPQPELALESLPAELARIVRRCLEKRRESRYHSAADLAHDLRASVTSPTVTGVRTPATPTPLRARVALGIGVLAAAAAVVATLLLLRPRPAKPSGLPRSLAVLPFRAIGSESTGEHFGLGVADSLISRLAAVRELTVRPTSAVARFETSPPDAAAAGRELGVDAVLEGTYQKLEGVTRVSVQMTDVGRSAILWSDRIELPEGRLFELQDAISRRIVEKLEVALDPEARRQFEGSQPVPDHLMEQYFAARALLPTVSATNPDQRIAIVAAFDRILAEQPTFARAIGARAYARAWLTFVQPTEENHQAALNDAARAVALDPNLAEPRVARASLAWSSLGGWDVVTAVRELRDAIARAPNLEIAHLDLARIHYHNGWMDESMREIEEARRLNPEGEAQRLAASLLTYQKSPEEGLAQFGRLRPESRGSWVSRWQAMWIRATLENPEKVLPDAEALYREAPPGDPVFATVLAVARARAGRQTADLEERILEADPRVGHFHHVLHFLADVRAIRNDTAGAVQRLGEAVKAGFPCAPCFDNDPLLASIRGSKEYAELKAEIARRTAGYRAALKSVL